MSHDVDVVSDEIEPRTMEKKGIGQRSWYWAELRPGMDSELRYATDMTWGRGRMLPEMIELMMMMLLM